MNFEKQFLVALPKMMDTAFSKSVVFLDKHSGDGATGWIVNKELDPQTAAKLRRGMNLNKNIPVFWGGPLEINSAVILHSNDFRIQSTIRLTETLSLTRDRAVINILNMGQLPEHFRIIVGQSSWAPGQLESEVLGSRTNGVSHWSSIPYSDDIIWNNSKVDTWTKSIDEYAKTMTNSVLHF